MLVRGCQNFDQNVDFLGHLSTFAQFFKQAELLICLSKDADNSLKFGQNHFTRTL